MNIFKEYYKVFNNKFPEWKFNLISLFLTIITVTLLIGGMLLMVRCSDKEQEKVFQETLYEIEIVDKYDCIGSTFHLVGGRAPEQEYHIIYKIRPLTETARKHYYGTGEEDDEVQYKVYRKLNIGQKFKGHYNYINAYKY